MLRVLTAAVLLPIALTSLFLGGYYFAIFLFIMSLIGCFEAARIIDFEDKFFIWLSLVLAVCFFLPAVFFHLHSLIACVFPNIVIFSATVLFYKRLLPQDFEKLATIFYWVLYINVGLISIYWISNTPAIIEERTGISLVLLTCLAVWCNDSFAYGFGRLMGRHPLFSSVSAKKTWEGFVAGSLLSVVSVLIGFYVPRYLGFDWLLGLVISDVWWIVCPAILLTPFGDLVESRLKRLYEVKDSSNILPGHGGMLDRIDSLLMVMPWAALYAFLIRPLI